MKLSILAVRSRIGEMNFYPLVENQHRRGILRISRAPVLNVADSVRDQAIEYAKRLLLHLNYVGVLAIEFFQVGDELLANEMAPRVHNSGHWTIEGARTSQFANHLRAAQGWPLGGTGTARPCGDAEHHRSYSRRSKRSWPYLAAKCIFTTSHPCRTWNSGPHYGGDAIQERAL